MLTVNLGERKGNYMGYNPATDDKLYLGYMALAYCIILPERDYKKNYNKIMRSLNSGIVERVIKAKKDKIIATNTKTGKSIVFKSYKDAVDHTGVSASTIQEAISKKRTAKENWKFEIIKAGEILEQ